MAKANQTPTTSRRSVLQGGAALAAAAILPIASR
jgi:TAT (twin-arginine translocation) pathway signal sequence